MHMYIYMYVCIYIFIHTYTRIYIYTYTCIFTYIFIDIHIHIHTYIISFYTLYTYIYTHMYIGYLYVFETLSLFTRVSVFVCSYLFTRTKYIVQLHICVTYITALGHLNKSIHAEQGILTLRREPNESIETR